MIYKYIVTIGDSLTTGARDECGLNYGFYLADILNNRVKTRWYCIQKAENGFVIEDVRKRIHDYCRSTPEAGIAVVLIGSNDAKDGGIPNAQFCSCYQQIIDVCKMHGRFIILCTLPPIVFGSMPEHFGRDVADHIRRYNRLIETLARDNNLSLCDLGKYINDSHLIDGIHFNNKGNYEVARLITNTLIGDISGGV